MATYPAPASSSGEAPVLNSWKEIANYLGLGVRTVQRYEKDFHLPVRRQAGKAHGSVIALSHDLDGWLLKAPLRNNDSKAQLRTISVVTAGRGLIAESTKLRSQSLALHNANRDALMRLTVGLRTIVEALASAKPAP